MDISSLDRRAIHKTLTAKGQGYHRHQWSAPPPSEWEYRPIPIDSGSETAETMSASMSMSMTLSEPDGQSVSEASVMSGQGRVLSPTKDTRRSSGGLGLDLRVSDGGGEGSKMPGRPSRLPSSTIASAPPRRGAPPSSMATPSVASVTPAKSSVQRSVTGGRTVNPSRNGKGPTSPMLTKHNLPPAPHRPLRLSDVAPTPDPHPHPAPSPAPPSALGIYMLAHRYDIAILEGLAKERILKGLTPENCMPML